MRIESVSTYNFRNLEDQVCDTKDNYVTLVGNNGEGKTNFLEAIYSACYGNSFRKSSLAQIRKFGTNESSVKVSVLLDSGEKITISMVIRQGTRSMYLNGREVRDRKELIYLVPCIVFTHEDIGFVQGSPDDKRRFFNQTMTLYDPLFLDDLRSYTGLLKQRNTLLKEERYDLIYLYDSQLSVVGMEIQKKRSALVGEFNKLFPELFSVISGDSKPLKTGYRPSWKECSSAEDAEIMLKESFSQDIRYQTTTTGPHRDRFIILQNGRNYIPTASTGQKRLVSLVLRSAQAAFYLKKTSTHPILLLDDVLLELDIERRARFLEHTRGFSQAFFTFLPGESYFRSGTFEGKVYKVEAGKLNEH